MALPANALIDIAYLEQMWPTAASVPGIFKATITLATFLATGTITINGLVFTAHASTTTVADREFSIGGTDTQDAAELVTCVNDATYGVPGVTASYVAGVVTLVAAGGSTITVSSSPDDGTCVKAIIETFVEELIDQASTIADRIARRTLAAMVHSEIYDGPGRSTLRLNNYPVSSVTSVHIDSARSWGAATEITDYFTEDGPGLLHYDGGFGSLRQSIQVIYTAGFSLGPPTEVPADLREAIVELVVWLNYRQAGNAIAVRATAGIDGVRTEHEISIPMNARRTIESYRRPD